MFYLLLTIVVMGILSGAEIDLFVPSFPDIQDKLGISTFKLELLLSINLLAHCITALVVGSLGDRFGRKKTIIGGIFIFIIGSILCVRANSYNALLTGRFIQGIGISGPAVLCFVLISDYFSISKQQQLMGIINGIITFAMAFAPVIGSYINLFFTWRGNFVVLLAIAIISLILSILYIPHESTVHNDTKITFGEYFSLLTDKKINYYIIILCLFSLPYYLFVSIAPILYVRDLGVSLKIFGFYQGAMALTYAMFSLFSAKLIMRYGSKICFLFSVCSLLLFLISCILLIIFQSKDYKIITLAMQFAVIGVIFPFNIMWPYFMKNIPNAKSKAAAIFTFSKFVLVTFVVQVVSYFYSGTFLVLGVALFITILSAIIGSYKLYKLDNFLDS